MGAITKFGYNPNAKKRVQQKAKELARYLKAEGPTPGDPRAEKGIYYHYSKTHPTTTLTLYFTTEHSEANPLIKTEGMREYGENYFFDAQLIAKKMAEFLPQTEAEEDSRGGDITESDVERVLRASADLERRDKGKEKVKDSPAFMSPDHLTFESDKNRRRGGKGGGSPTPKGTPRVLDERGVMTAATEFVKQTRMVNLQLSLLDAKMRLLQSWKSFLEVTLLRQSKFSMFSLEKEETPILVIQGLVDLLSAEEENQEDDPVMEVRMENLSHLLLLMISQQLKRRPHGSYAVSKLGGTGKSASPPFSL